MHLVLKQLRSQFSFGLFYCLNCGNFVNVWLQKISIPPPQKGFFLRPPNHSRNSHQASYITLRFSTFGSRPPRPAKFSFPSVGKYGYYLELHNDIFFQLIMFKNIWQSKFHITSMVNGYICDMVQCFREQKFNLSNKVKSSELPWKLQCEKIDLIKYFILPDVFFSSYQIPGKIPCSKGG